MKQWYLIIVMTAMSLLCLANKFTYTPNVGNVNISDNPPGFDYKIQVPKGWQVCDTFVDGLKLKLIYDAAEVNDRPFINILITKVDDTSFDNFVQRNINYLVKNLPDTEILDRGKLKVGKITALWFAYTKNDEMGPREVVNYIIPYKGYAYFMSAAVNQGAMPKYRKVFDKMASSLRP